MSVEVSGGGSGILTADLRGLDAVRTLVLVNGRRFAPADSRGLTDLTSIPDALVERVDIMTGGASAVYGSDAIAGAINFILKDDFEGLEFGYYGGETFESDATTQKFDLTIGGNFADGRGNAVVSGSQEQPEKLARAATSVKELQSLTVSDLDGVAKKYLTPNAGLPIAIVPQPVTPERASAEAARD